MTNVPHKYSAVGVFCNDLSDHCAVVAVRNTKVPKTNPRFIRERNLKCFNEQAFFHDLFYFDWSRLSLSLMWKLPGNSFMMVFPK